MFLSKVTKNLNIFRFELFFSDRRFQEKTSNDFYQRQNFVKHPGKYDFVQLDFNPELPVETEKKNEISQPIPVSKLDQRVQDLIKLICDVRAMEEMLIELKFDAKKNPLGKENLE